MKSLPWMEIRGRQLVADSKPLQLRGIGLGNWMLVEFFMIGLPQVDYVMRQAFEEVLGHEKASAFWSAFMESYFTEKDFERIKSLGFNHVRLPFSYRHFESDAAPGVWKEEGFRLLDKAIGWCRKHGLWVILDLHSAPGCQASDWNAESAHGEAFLWDDITAQKRVAALWGELARRYKDEPAVMAYEILNEPVTMFPHQVAGMNAFHHRCIAAIRKEDRRHIILVNGDKHATDLEALDEATFADPQVMAAFHFYHQFTPPLREITSFPCVHEGKTIDAAYVIAETGLPDRGDGKRIDRPAFLDEFGIFYWSEAVGSQRGIIEAVITWCEQNNTHWNLWHWKDVRGMGLLHMKEGQPWLKLLEKIGATKLKEESGRALDAYMKSVDAFLPLEGKRRSRLREETRRDLEMQMLWSMVEKMSDLTADDLAKLGTSFGSENFEIDAPMESILRRLMGTL
jgi:endoglucanase